MKKKSTECSALINHKKAMHNTDRQKHEFSNEINRYSTTQNVNEKTRDIKN